jgi:hypothetical protein
MLEGAYSNVQQNKAQWRRDLDQRAGRARAEAATMEHERQGDSQATAGRYGVSETPATDLDP